MTEICALLAPREWAADEWHLRKGQIIHLVTQWDDENCLEESSVDPMLLGYLGAYRKFKQKTSFKPVQIESQFYHPKYRYCGRPDRYGMFVGRRHVWILDIKSGAPHEADLLQAPAYLFGIKANGFPVDKCGDLYLRPNGTYRLEEVKNPTEKFLCFLGGLKLWREQNGNNG